MPHRAGLRKLAEMRPPMIVDRQAVDAGRGHVPGRRVEDVRLKAQPLGAAEHVTVLPVDLPGRAVEVIDIWPRRRRRRAGGPRRRPCRAGGRTASSVLLSVIRPRRPPGSRAGCSARPRSPSANRGRPARCRGTSARRPGESRSVRSSVASPNGATGPGAVTNVTSIVSAAWLTTGRDRQDLGQRTPLFAEIIDDPRLGGAQAPRPRPDRRDSSPHAPRSAIPSPERLAGAVDHADRSGDGTSGPDRPGS